MSRKKFIIVGIDEAGRGPLAGPVAVAAVAAVANSPDFVSGKAGNSKSRIHDFSTKFFKLGRNRDKLQNGKVLKNIKDSKKLSEKQREEWFEILKNNFEYKVAMVGPKIIDKVGIKRATQMALDRALNRLLHSKIPDVILLDGLLKAPKRYNQETIIKGDEKIPLISAASIIAKVKRDRKMRRLSEKYPEYCFDCHKGYGTKLHYDMIKKHGRLVFHRNSFFKNEKQGQKQK